jgi:hypothetical protein
LRDVAGCDLDGEPAVGTLAVLRHQLARRGAVRRQGLKTAAG